MTTTADIAAKVRVAMGVKYQRMAGRESTLNAFMDCFERVGQGALVLRYDSPEDLFRSANDRDDVCLGYYNTDEDIEAIRYPELTTAVEENMSMKGNFKDGTPCPKEVVIAFVVGDGEGGFCRELYRFDIDYVHADGRECCSK